MQSFLRLLIIISALLLSACAQQAPRRPTVDTQDLTLGYRKNLSGCAGSRSDATTTTPERWENFTLHFIEFDDQGWSYPEASSSGATPGVGNASEQLDCALLHLAGELESGKDVALYVYVHGWHHNADFDDRDVVKFRKLLHSHADATKDRTVIGIYIGWEGETISTPVLTDLLTFVTRKNAAHRVADGRVREFFSRLKGLRSLYNRSSEGSDCAERKNSTEPDHCRLRAVMIGHSFGGLILYSAVQPYLLETLTASARTPPSTGEQSKALAKEPRSRGIADLVVLLNPAFEASLFEPLHRASLRYDENLPPLLISISSMADSAVRRYFQWARGATTVFQYPATSSLESEALRDNIGNVDEYVTHALCVPGPGGSCKMRKTPTLPAEKICDMEFSRYTRSFQSANIDPPIWNIRTYEDVIHNHNDIWNPRTQSFVMDVYSRITKGHRECLDSEPPSPTRLMPSSIQIR